MSDSRAGLSWKLEKVTEAEERSQHPPQPVQPSSHDSSQPCIAYRIVSKEIDSVKHCKISGVSSVTDHVPETEDGYNVVEVVSEPLHVVRVVAGVEACGPAFLCEVVGGYCQEVSVHDLAVRDPVRSAGVDSPPSPVLGRNVQTRMN